MFEDLPRVLALEGVQVESDDRPLFSRIAAPTHAVFRFGSVDPAELPSTYPTAIGIEQSGTRTNVFGSEEPVFRFPNEDGSLRPLHEVGSRPSYGDERLNDYVLRPKVGSGTSRPPSEFLTLWALLFCLSELARYYPDTWVKALDPDSSPAAVTLEHGLDVMLERAPQLIAGSLAGPLPELIRRDLREREEHAAAAAGEPDETGDGHESDSSELPEPG
jgi:hypothetical protein